jgi:5-bromo-4-chloroindolyl phosphate hydrolysis protein
MSKKSGHPLLPLLILIIVLGFLALVGFVVYSIARDIAQKAAQKLEEHDVSFSKKGMEIKVKEMKEEDYVGATQS